MKNTQTTIPIMIKFACCKCCKEFETPKRYRSFKYECPDCGCTYLTVNKDFITDEYYYVGEDQVGY